MPVKRGRTTHNPYIWNKHAVPVEDDDDKRGKFRWDMDKTLGRGMTRYNVRTDWLEWVFPNIDLKITMGQWTITVATSVTSNIGQTLTSTVGNSTTHTCPINTVNGEVYINGNVIVSGDVIASGVSLVHHTHTGCMGGSTGQPH